METFEISHFENVVGRILVEFKEFSWLRAVIPAHIYHPYQKEMSQKSAVYELPIMMKNEAKHEDCVDILDQYEEVLGEIFLKAFGRTTIILYMFIFCLFINLNMAAYHHCCQA